MFNILYLFNNEDIIKSSPGHPQTQKGWHKMGDDLNLYVHY